MNNSGQGAGTRDDADGKYKESAVPNHSRIPRHALAAAGLVAIALAATSLGRAPAPPGAVTEETAQATVAAAREVALPPAAERGAVPDLRDRGVVDAVVAEAPLAAAHGPAIEQAAEARRAATQGGETSVASNRLSAAARAKMSDPVAALAEAGGNGPVELVVRYDTHPERFEHERIRSLGGEVIRTYRAFRMRAIRVPAHALEAFALEDSVNRLSLDDAVSATSVTSRIAAGVPDATARPSAGLSAAMPGMARLEAGAVCESASPAQT